MERMSAEKAVSILCERWRIGEKKTGRAIQREVENILLDAGVPEVALPMQVTIMRRMRDIDDSYGVHIITGKCKSTYIKEEPKEWVAKVIQARGNI
ncbi:MAG: hypothetical protein ACQ5SW_10455 [Sphaerochaetaceae bacterium]